MFRRALVVLWLLILISCSLHEPHTVAIDRANPDSMTSESSAGDDEVPSELVEPLYPDLMEPFIVPPAPWFPLPVGLGGGGRRSICGRRSDGPTDILCATNKEDPCDRGNIFCEDGHATCRSDISACQSQIFLSSVTYNTDSVPDAIALGDVNGDGAIDMVVANSFADTVSVLLNRGDGTFLAAA